MRPDLKITHITIATFQAVLSLWCKIYHKDATPETQLAVTETTGNLQVDSDPLNSNTIKQHLRGSMSCFLCFCETPGYLGTLAKVLCVFACPSLFLFWNYKEKNFHWTIRCGTEKTRSYRSSSLATGRIKIRVFPFDKFIHWSVITAYATVGHMLKNTGALKSMLPICWSKDSLTLFLFTSFHTHFTIFCGGHWKKCPQISSLNILCRGASRMGQGQLGYGCLIYSPQLHSLSSIHLRSSSTTPLSSIRGWTPTAVLQGYMSSAVATRLYREVRRMSLNLRSSELMLANGDTGIEAMLSVQLTRLKVFNHISYAEKVVENLTPLTATSITNPNLWRVLWVMLAFVHFMVIWLNYCY